MNRIIKLAAGAVALVLALPAAAMAVFPGTNGKIAFVSGRGGAPNDDSGSDVYTLDEPEGHIDPLTAAAGQHRHPSWSPDGKQIAYALFDGANDRDIWIHDVGTPSRSRLTISPLVQEDRPTWSANGRKVAYESEVTDGSNQQDILITNVKTNDTINLTNTVTAVEGRPVWSPNGETIYYSRRANTAATDEDILKEPSDNSSAVPSFVLNSATAEYQPALSPDGSEMCFTRGPFGSDAADVYKVASSGLGPQTNISDNGLVGDYNCTWSPDGRKIAFVQGVFSAGALVYKNSNDTGGTALLTSDTPQHFDGNPDWAPVPGACKRQQATIAGTDDDDELAGTRRKDVIVAFDDDDTVRAKRAGDIACGNDGNDKLVGGRGGDTLIGGRGRDLLIGGRGKDKCIGGRGTDVIKCERGSD